MIQSNASLHYEGLSEAYSTMLTHPFISINRYAVADTSFRLSGFRDDRPFHSLNLSSFIFLSSSV